MLPTFIGIGAQRAGTTWAYNCLAEHPDVFMTNKKELHFFYVNYGRGLEWYEQQFAEAGNARARGEITPDYMYHESALRNIAKDIPDARLFVVLRNPIDRAVSQYALHRDRFGNAPFSAVSTPDSELVVRGLYFQHLQMVYSYFSSDQVRVLLYDDLSTRPGEFLEDLYGFVGVDTGFRPPSLQTRYNRVIYPGFQKVLLGSGLGWIIDGVKKTGLGEWIRQRNAGDRRDDGFATSQDLARLRGYFRSDVENLSRLLSRDLGNWLQ